MFLFVIQFPPDGFQILNVQWQISIYTVHSDCLLSVITVELFIAPPRVGTLQFLRIHTVTLPFQCAQPGITLVTPWPWKEKPNNWLWSTIYPNLLISANVCPIYLVTALIHYIFSSLPFFLHKEIFSFFSLLAHYTIVLLIPSLNSLAATFRPHEETFCNYSLQTGAFSANS